MSKVCFWLIFFLLVTLRYLLFSACMPVFFDVNVFCLLRLPVAVKVVVIGPWTTFRLPLPMWLVFDLILSFTS